MLYMYVDFYQMKKFSFKMIKSKLYTGTVLMTQRTAKS